ncbi:anhydro-N-acetylmuramic acid kinase [Tenacibaculum sp. S7007]|uniref:Anhydro-N-acetylmuramic acid kinase n=1 Tax=Tenacibaculum pelagium TaxID=2759527 RepID=A0A839API6_9FLAO|nr:anhydro-N-acetylmuramic acid kinase [Tenacibaculum pelagium]MBA6156268.1 anhydro-N-acetylmuramic acid kinase [Tenacibaculum pelagium]
MPNKYIYCIGLMSGTSLDGIDIAYIKINNNSYQDFEIIQAETFTYSKKWKDILREAIFYTKENLKKLDIEYGKLLGALLNDFIDKYKVSKLDFIASHGHTILHEPHNGVTLQIGNGQEIAKITNKKIICDFRTQDVDFGGQGAPLVPIGDKLMFSNYSHCLNLGGFANVSFEKNNARIAFDICPVNIVLNHYTNKLGFEFDDRGQMASGGKVNEELLEKLNSLEFYQKTPPKSLGLEWVQQNVFPLIDDLEKNIETILRTFVEHAAIQIGTVLNESSTVLVTGGGIFNSFLMQRIEYYSSKKIEIPSKELIEYKEALIFAFLGLLKNKNEINCLQSVTGAVRDHSSGVIFYPEK